MSTLKIWTRDYSAEALQERAKRMWVNYRGLVKQPLPMDVAVGLTDVANAGTSPRLAVAYGLSFPEINIGRISPPNEILTSSQRRCGGGSGSERVLRAGSR